MLKKWAAGILIATTSGCAWIVQEHLPSNYDGKSAPHCDTASWPVAVDIISAVLDVIAIAALTSDSKNMTQGPELALNIADGAISVLSAGTGVKWSDDCKAARKKYDERIARIERERAATPVVVPPVVLPPPPPPAPIATFHCFASPTDGNVGLCTRTLAECDAARADAGACGDAAIADCFHYTTVVDGVSHEVCGPTLATCNHRRDSAIAIGPSVSDIGECQEAK